MACGTDKVETGMNSKVNLVLTFRLLFLTHVGFVLLSVLMEYGDTWSSRNSTIGAHASFELT